MSTSYYKYTCGSTGNQKTFTLSGWFKRGNLGEGTFFGYYSSAGSNPRSEIYLNASNQIVAGLNPTGSAWLELTYPNALRDPAAWYHVVFAYDTTQGVEADRIKVYVNGNQITASSGTYPTLNLDTGFNVSGYDQHIGMYQTGSMIWDGCVAHVNLTDGTAYAPTAFGEFDATSSMWMAKSGPSVTYGTNGGFYKFEAGALTTDSSGEGNTLTSTGTPTSTKDNPDNNFATLNPLENFYNGATFSNGNNTVGASGSNYSWNGSTQLMTAGKWYFEVLPGAAVDMMIGISGNQPVSTTQVLGNKLYQWGFNSDNGKYQNNAVDSATYSDTWDSGDYMGVYLDLDNNKLYLGKNGVIQNSGVGASITAPSSFVGTTQNYGGYVFAVGDYTTGSGIFECNFGNGYFGTTVISSPEADAGGEGAFKYDPSAGTFDSASKDFRALCTNNISTYG